MLKSGLTAKQEDLIKQERHWLADLQTILGKLGISKEEQATLNDSIEQLDELFLLVVVGEFNAGKSAFINALIGQTLLKEGVTPTTAEINVLKYSDSPSDEMTEAHLRVITQPLEMLRHLNIVDTPGTNAVIQEHQEITEHFVPRSDLVLFITSADRPFTETERTFLSRIREWGKKVVIIINKIDIFENEVDLNKVIEFVRENATVLLGAGAVPEIFPISGRLALRSKLNDDSASWEQSRFERLEDYIRETLDETTRLRLKLLNPLGVGDNLVSHYAEVIDERMTLLVDDLDTLENLDAQFKLYEDDMQRDFKYRLADIENLLFDLEKRGHAYFDETIRVARVVDLVKKDYIRRGFEEQVVANLGQLIEEKVNELVDWMVNADLNQWQAVTDYLKERKQEYDNKLIGEIDTNFRYDRDRLVEAVARSVQRVVDSYNKEVEATKIADGARNAVIGTAITEVGAFGLGAVAMAIVTGAMLDVTMFLGASGVAALGFFIIPRSRETAKKDLTNRMNELRVHLSTTLTSQFDKEMTRSVQRIKDAIAPYTRFVRAERVKLEESQKDLNEAQRTQARLRAEIEAM